MSAWTKLVLSLPIFTFFTNVFHYLESDTKIGKYFYLTNSFGGKWYPFVQFSKNNYVFTTAINNYRVYNIKYYITKEVVPIMT